MPRFVAGAILILVMANPAFGEQVTITAPASITFTVNDAGQSSTASPNPSVLSYSGAVLVPGPQKALRISVKADAANFTPPSGNSIPATSLSWTTSNAQGGTGYNGSLSTTYTILYQSNLNPSSGSVDITWTLSAPGSGIRAGDHNLTLRWKLESVAP